MLAVNVITDRTQKHVTLTAPGGLPGYCSGGESTPHSHWFRIFFKTRSPRMFLKRCDTMWANGCAWSLLFKLIFNCTENIWLLVSVCSLQLFRWMQWKSNIIRSIFRIYNHYCKNNYLWLSVCWSFNQPSAYLLHWWIMACQEWPTPMHVVIVVVVLLFLN